MKVYLYIFFTCIFIIEIARVVLEFTKQKIQITKNKEKKRKTTI